MNNHLDDQHIKKIENINFQPVFILGLHRSGTSIFYKMLTETNCFNAVTTYHLIKFNELLHNHINKIEEKSKKDLTNYLNKIQKDRKIDCLKISADFAEEYGFLLASQTSKSIITKKNLYLFNTLGKKIQFISENNKPLLLKNPIDFPNFIFIKKHFPNAKFIFIHRHPFKVSSSFIKAFRLLIIEKNPYISILLKQYNQLYNYRLLLYTFRMLTGSLSPIGALILIKYSTLSVKKYLKYISKLSQSDFVEVTYETLCEKPNETITEILDFLKIEKKDIDFSNYIKSRKTNLDPNVIKFQSFIYKNMKKYFEKFNYSSSI
ncbi:Sulfotransferase family [Thermoplasmatales archaeon SCGC AB-540-F20]|nr:Sulfotransferase family [Thermoplasmatales archaeon SCGC AB-540-F20]